MPEPWWIDLLRQQRAAGFADLAGGQGTLVLPVDDRLLSRLIASRIPPSWPVKELTLRAAAGNQLVVRLKLTKAFLPTFTLRLMIERQPVLPASPVLVLRIVSDGVAALAGTLMRFLPPLPPGLRLNGDLLSINLATLLDQYGAGEALAYLTLLELTTTEGRLVVSARAAVPDPPASRG